MRDLLRFLYIALREYWATWVTGTGLAGFTLWAINYYSDRVRKKPMSLRANAMILFCFFWFLATFSAWHDADKNLEAVKRQRAQDTSDLAACRGDFKAEHTLRESLDAHNKSLQGSLNSQQASINTCVVTLAKTSAAEPFRAYAWPVRISTTDKPIITELVLVGSRPITFRGELECDQPFEIVDWVMTGTVAEMGVVKRKVQPGRYHLEAASPQWEPQAPVAVTVISSVALHSCRFTLRQ